MLVGIRTDLYWPRALKSDSESTMGNVVPSASTRRHCPPKLALEDLPRRLPRHVITFGALDNVTAVTLTLLPQLT